jgi:hypothetical protein
MAGVVRDLRGPSDDATDPWQRPQVRGKPGGAGAAQEDHFNAVQGGIIEPRSRAGATGRREGGATVTPPCGVPAAGRLTTHVEALDDGGLIVAMAKEVRGDESTRFQARKISTG